MPQKIDVHGLFIDPETITDLRLLKRIAVYQPVFQEVATSKSFWGRQSATHSLEFMNHQPYGIILADAEQPDASGFIVNYKEAVIDRFLKGLNRTGKSIVGHITEILNIEINGDRQYRILQSGRIVKQTTIREIPAKVRLLSGQWVDVFKSSPEYDFRGGSPYSVTDVNASSLLIVTEDEVFVLFGCNIDATDEEIVTAYKQLTTVYNQIQERKDEAKIEQKKRPLLHFPQINIQLPNLGKSKLRLQSPFVLGKQSKDSKMLEQEEDNSIEVSGK